MSYRFSRRLAQSQRKLLYICLRQVKPLSADALRRIGIVQGALKGDG
jgi:hypothetical protein